MFQSQHVQEKLVELLAKRNCRLVSPDGKRYLVAEQEGLVTFYVVYHKVRGERKPLMNCKEISVYRAMKYLLSAFEVDDMFGKEK